MTTKSKGESIRQRLSALGAKLGVRYSNLETAFLIERLVARLVSDNTLGKNLVFKGGFVGLTVYESPRYTVDLDALLVKADVESTLRLTRQNAELDLHDGVWFRFEDQVDLSTQGEYGGIRQVYRAGIGDPITPGPRKTESPSVLFEDEDLSWTVYPIETIIAEKIHALIAHGDTNSRSKDVHDLAIFLPRADTKVLDQAIMRCFEFRSTDRPSSFAEALVKLDTTRLERGWPSAVASVRGAPSFKSAFATLLKLIAEAEKSSAKRKA